jgi:hypothetical protein
VQAQKWHKVCGDRHLPFFMRTSDTFVSLIWFDGVLIPTGILRNYGGYLRKVCCAEMRVARKIFELAMVQVGWCIIALAQNDSPQG